MNKKALMITSIVLIVLFFGFYWFQWRPNEIRRNCEFEIFSKEGVRYKGSVSTRQNNKYRQCMVKNGLAPESLFVNTD